MARGAPSKAKIAKKEKALKKAKIKKVKNAGILILLAVVITAVAVFFFIQQKDTEIYSHNGQVVRLLADGSFQARLPHNVRIDGTYSKSEDNGVTTVSFDTDGRTVTGRIINDILHIPPEWDDGHGHGNRFPRR